MTAHVPWEAYFFAAEPRAAYGRSAEQRAPKMCSDEGFPDLAARCKDAFAHVFFRARRLDDFRRLASIVIA